MKIAMVSEHANPLAELGEVDAGGQNLHVAELSAALARQGHDVTVYTRRDSARAHETVRAPGGYRVVHLSAGPARHVPKDELPQHMNDFAWQLSNHLHLPDNRPDVIHSHFWMSGMVSVLVARQHKVPVVQTYHALGTVKRRYQGEADTSPASRLAIERAIGRSADAIAATCSDEAFELTRMGIARERISIVPCGVDTNQFSPQGLPGRKSGPNRVISVGRLVPRKGFDDLIEAIAAVPGTELVIAGGPGSGGLQRDAEARRLRARAKELGVGDRVRLIGQVARKDMPALLCSADVVACVPWYEPFGIVPLEAMACGTTVLASAVGGLLDTVVDGITGVLVPPRKPAVIAAGLRKLMANPGLRTTLGAAGCDRARARYTWERVALDTLRVYQGCLQAAGDTTLARTAGSRR